jgi:hypothetical protein
LEIRIIDIIPLLHRLCPIISFDSDMGVDINTSLVYFDFKVYVVIGITAAAAAIGFDATAS